MTRSIFLALLLAVQPIIAVSHTPSNQSAPAFALKDLQGRTVRLSDYKGKVLLINFWATWCAPCLVEMPDLVKLQKEYESQGLQIVGITCPPMSRKDVRGVARKLKINYPILFGTDEVSDAYYATSVLPTTIVIDRNGKVRGRILGILVPEEFERNVKPLLTDANSK
ncbi:MAG TPA: TlpA disulfide reductase family protein [Blastocatellia bacterium]|nr:TlpA disulfide reductase family protein [Blastocatellia bacterium]